MHAIDSRMRHPKKFTDVLGKKMAYVEAGEGDPIVFLHGNITSSYMWRNIIPHLEGLGRCIAVDNIGQGDSEKLDGSMYRLADHQAYVDGILEVLKVQENVTLVVHDWGAQTEEVSHGSLTLSGRSSSRSGPGSPITPGSGTFTWPRPFLWPITTGRCSAMADAGPQAGIKSRGEGIIAPRNGESRLPVGISKGGGASYGGTC